MNNDELKKKIVDILHRDFIAREVTPVYIGEDGEEKIMPQRLCNVFNNLTEQALIPYFADALIEAGIGDVKEVNCELTRIEVLKRERFAEEHGFTPDCTPYYIAEQYKHRAEVAERALDLCETAYILALNGREHEGISQQAIVSDLGVHGFFMEQAEKELSAELKGEER